MYLTSTKFLIFSSSALACGTAGGCALYMALKEDVRTTEKIMHEKREFWDGKIDLLEHELVRLRKEGKGEDNKLIQKIVQNIEGSISFNLKNDGSGFIDKEKTISERKDLADFCRDTKRHSDVQADLIKKLCEKSE